MDPLFFSIIVVCLNPGQKLSDTMDSILSQTWGNYEVIVKDGGSTDGSAEKLPEDERIHFFRQDDTGIYDAMNQAAALAKGRYLLFLNCGDLFYDADVLQKTAAYILKEESERLKEQSDCLGKTEVRPRIFYGNQYNSLQESVVYSAPEINDFACYRNVPCHQVCFYDRNLFAERAYDTKYKVRADYEHFLSCIYEKKAKAVYTGVMTAKYEGGGFSETKENRKRSAAEHREITKRYLGAAKCMRYRFILLLTLAPLRTKIAESPVLSVWYNRVKTTIYRWKAGKKA